MGDRVGFVPANQQERKASPLSGLKVLIVDDIYHISQGYEGRKPKRIRELNTANKYDYRIVTKGTTVARSAVHVRSDVKRLEEYVGAIRAVNEIEAIYVAVSEKRNDQRVRAA